MKTTIYVPVYIEGKEENLPKEEDIYWTKQNDRFKNETTQYYCLTSKPIKDYWLVNVLLYLKPVVLPDDEEIIDAMDDYGQKHSEDVRGYSIYGITSTAFNKGAKWFKSQILNK